MLVVKVELWPGGDESQKKELGTAWISNDGTGTTVMGNYDYVVIGQRRILKHGRGKVRGFPRARKNVWDLLRLVLKDRDEKINPST